MKLIAKKLITFRRKIVKPGEEFEVAKSQGLLMIKNTFAEPAKKEKAKKEKPVIEEIKPYEEWLKKELIEELEAREIEYEKSFNKEQLVELLEDND